MDILLIDDDEGTLETVGDFLARHGHVLRTAPAGQAAIAQMEQRLPDLVISDI